MKIKTPGKKVVLATLFSVLFIGLIYGGYVALDRGWKFANAHKLVRHQMVNLSFNRPFEIVTNEEFAQRQEMDRIIQEVSDIAITEYLSPGSTAQEVKCEVSKAINPTEFFNVIRKHESSNGKDTNPVALHNYCRSKGMWNEIGYNPQNKYCYKDMVEAELHVAYYVKKNCDGLSMDQCLCFWNTGKPSATCAYSEGDLSMAN